ncbi:MAG TPA: HdeD family acid-resistance protein [Pirellulales bacterium]
MSTPEPLAPVYQLTELHLVGVESLKRRWGWFVGLGVLLIVFGALAVSYSVITSLAVTAYLGALMILAGAFETVHAFSVRDWSGFFLDLLTGVLYMIFGATVFIHPGEAAIVLTFLIAVFLVIVGVSRIVAAVSMKFSNRSLLLLHGVVSLLLGISIWRAWPMSGLQIIGIFVGIDMIFNGFSLVMLGLGAKNLPARAA